MKLINLIKKFTLIIWKDYKIESFFFVFALLLRIPFFIFEAVFWDESFSWLISQNSFTGIFAATAKDTHPPLYYEVLKVWNSIFSDNILSMRTLSMVSFAISYIIVVRFVRKFTKNKVSRMLTYFYLSIMLTSIWLSSMARMYSFGLMLILAGLYFYDKYRENKKLQNLFFFSLFSLLSLYNLNISVFVWAGIILFHFAYIIFPTISKNYFKQVFSNIKQAINKQNIIFVFSQIFVFALYFPWFLVAIKQSSGPAVNQLKWLPEFSWNIFSQVSVIIFGSPYIGDELPWWLGYILWIFILLFGFFTIKDFFTKRSKYPIVYYTLFILFFSVLSVSLMSLKDSIVSSRTFFFAAILFIITFMSTLKVSQKLFMKVLIIILVMITIPTTGLIYSSMYSYGTFNDKVLTNFLSDLNSDNQTKIIVTRQEFYYPIGYQHIKYFTRSNPKTIMLDKDTDTGDYIIYSASDFIKLEDINQNFYYFMISQQYDLECRDVSGFQREYQKKAYEFHYKYTLCKYNKI